MTLQPSALAPFDAGTKPTAPGLAQTDAISLSGSLSAEGGVADPENVFLIQDLTRDVEALQEAIVSTEPLGGTSLYDAIHAAYRKIGTFKGRKVFVVLSDGSTSIF